MTELLMQRLADIAEEEDQRNQVGTSQEEDFYNNDAADSRYLVEQQSLSFTEENSKLRTSS
jgi:hypothetical protein